jgi:hypothetical protein
MCVKNGNGKINDVLLVGMNSEKPFQNYSKQFQSVTNFLDNDAKHKLVFIHSPTRNR